MSTLPPFVERYRIDQGGTCSQHGRLIGVRIFILFVSPGLFLVNLIRRVWIGNIFIRKKAFLDCWSLLQWLDCRVVAIDGILRQSSCG